MMSSNMLLDQLLSQITMAKKNEKGNKTKRNNINTLKYKTLFVDSLYNIIYYTCTCTYVFFAVASKPFVNKTKKTQQVQTNFMQ